MTTEPVYSIGFTHPNGLPKVTFEFRGERVAITSYDGDGMVRRVGRGTMDELEAEIKADQAKRGAPSAGARE